ncbi:MAG: 1-(5-phosphoribosyl)-5-[(5-phosphoribosylamino)methylideneamino]imidazole-4-carboxamide isomerase [Alphaproteobacteria bacterium]|nr:1-(5-phosphoribosyl)-5-[(5-phosphoribosylamino)methylideneamino]imidazole-4-carboxamide isomerase [Alphaproteobacteria bacterium]
MILYPAIDLKDGHCVRLVRGDMEQATVFNTDPGAQAQIFASQGFAWIHVVDLNGAFSGKPVNAAAVDSVLKATHLKIQLGGGIRTLAAIEGWLDKGVARVVLGTVALRDPALVRDACTRWPGKVAVGVDARAGHVAVEGWAESSDITVLALARQFDDAGVAAIIHTDIERDGAMRGLNVEATVELARSISTPVIASGGVSSIDDLRHLKWARAQGRAPGIAGVIAGRALYDGRVDATAALALLAD